MRLRNLGIAGISGAVVSVAFTLFITGLENFLPFFPVVLAVGVVAGISGSIVPGSNIAVPVILGGVIALACCVVILLYAVSNI